MKTYLYLFIVAVFSIAPLTAQENPPQVRPPVRSAISGPRMATNSTGNYESDIVVVNDAQAQALEQARQMLEDGENLHDRSALQAAIKEMERAQATLEAAKNSSEKLPAALAAEQAAYQALLKLTPREYRMTRSRNGQSGGQNQSQQRQLDQLEMQREENRYETERQAAAPPNAQQREQLQTADRLKELAQRQQDLNERLRELQNALQSARTDQEREDIQRQLKRLRDEERQMLANVDELRQQLEQSPNASSQAETRQQLDQTRSDMERAAQEMERQSASQALAAGTRAQERMQNLREDLRRQTSSQFTEQMRQLRNEARELTRQQDEIARGLDSLNNGERQSLDNSAERQQIARQMAQQQGTLTNLLAGMRNVTEQAETTEPLLAQKLYDTLRRADQMHTDNLLQMGTQLMDRGFLPQASQMERAVRTNITELAQSVESAAESVLGSEADALRYAQKELDDLTRQVERELSSGTNAAAGAGENGGSESQSNRVARADGRSGNGSGEQGANLAAGANGRSAGSESQLAGNNSQGQQRGETNSSNGEQSGNRGQRANDNGNQQASSENPQNGQGEAASGTSPGQGNRGEANQQSAGNNSPNRQANSGQRQRGGQAQNGGNAGGDRNAGAENGGAGGGDRLRQFAVELGRGDRAFDNGGPITGTDFVNWSDRLRDVEQVVDAADLRNQLGTVRERVAAYRAEYRDLGRIPQSEAVRQQILVPLTQVRVWLREELARTEKGNNLVPLDRDPVPENYSELVRKYYEKLGSAQ